MVLNIIMAVFSVLSVISAVFLGWNTRARAVKSETVAAASRDAVLKNDMDYIRRGIDDMRIEQKAQGQRFDILTERVTRVEEAAKAAHKRIDRIEGKE